MNKSTKNNFWVFLSLTILLLAGFCVLIYFTDQSKTKIQVLKTQIYSKERQIKNVDSLKRLLLSTTESRLKIHQLFVGSGNTVEFLENLESLGRSSGADVEVVSVGEDTSIGKKKEDKVVATKMRVKFSGEGSWVEVYKLVGLVSNLSYSMQITGLDLTKDKDSTGLWSIVFEIIVDKV